jgi:4-amino-4-deoxy-L-arabinose transferase-like glycosyltransferase
MGAVWRGMTPYRDFFEHHGPVLWYLSSPLFAIWRESLDVLHAGRVIVWLLGAATAAITWHVALRLYGRWAAAIAAFLLMTLPAYQEKNAEWRPDNVAVLLVMLAVLGLGKWQSERGTLWAGLGGAALSAAFLCTQKVVYVAAGIVVSFIVTVLLTPWPRRWRPVAAMAAGVAIVVAAMAVFLASQAALHDYLRMTLVMPLRWKIQEPILPYLVWTLAAAPVFWAAFVAGVALSVPEVGHKAAQAPGAVVVLGGAVTHAAGLLVVPAAFHQYYLPLAPLAALLGARALVTLSGWQNGEATTDQVTPRIKVLALLAAGPAAVVCFLLRVRFRGIAQLAVGAFSTWFVGAGLALAVLATAILAVRSDRAANNPRTTALGSIAVITLLATAAVGAVPFLWLQFRWDTIHDVQTRQIERLLRATAPGDRMFDGFSGYGALRPHAFFYYWLNDHSWPMVPDADKVSGVLRALADSRTRVVLYDRNLKRHLPPQVHSFLAQEFAPDPRYSDSVCSVLVKRGRELPPTEDTD